MTHVSWVVLSGKFDDDTCVTIQATVGTKMANIKIISIKSKGLMANFIHIINEQPAIAIWGTMMWSFQQSLWHACLPNNWFYMIFKIYIVFGKNGRSWRHWYHQSQKLLNGFYWNCIGVIYHLFVTGNENWNAYCLRCAVSEICRDKNGALNASQQVAIRKKDFWIFCWPPEHIGHTIRARA